MSLIFVTVFALAIQLGLSESIPCEQYINRTLNIDDLTGTWYVIMHFGHEVEYSDCSPAEIKKSTECLEIDGLDRHVLNEKDFSLRDHCLQILVGNSTNSHLFMIGNKELKYYIDILKLGTRNLVTQKKRVLMKINADYVLGFDCPNKDVKWLLSRHQFPTKDELNKTVDTIEEVRGLPRFRHWCEALKQPANLPGSKNFMN